MSEKKCLVSSIERFTTNDGPGIRTIVFLKGCPLRCKWCSSPETHHHYPEILYESKKCIGCGDCSNVCKRNAIQLNEIEKVELDWSNCNNCLECTKVCASGALSVKGHYIAAEEVVSEIERDSVFYRETGGGVTISGGEPFMQIDCIINILRICNELNINTALETSGYIDWSKIKIVLPFINLLFVDLKCVNPKKHRELTGKSSKQILKNIRKIDQQTATDYIIRFPFIPSLNDSIEDVKELCSFINNLDRIKLLEILPYHELGVEMYDNLGKTFSLERIKPPDDEQINKIRRDISSKLKEHIKINQLN